MYINMSKWSSYSKFDYKKVLNYINDTDYTVVAFTAPAVRVAIGDEFGFESGAFLEGKMVSALKNIDLIMYLIQLSEQI